ncbi:MAG: phosphoribosylamine--glycine ligase [Bacteroidales bacterium]|jgi:phosphoribosylamine--glycine ligase
MKILVLGSGGREHALAWKLAQSPLVDELYVAPGNAGTGTVVLYNGKQTHNISLSPLDFPKVKDTLRSHGIDMLVVGPEEPLVKGIADYCHKQPELQDVLVVGPTAAGAQLEGSKDFAKQFMHTYGIPTAGYKTFTNKAYAEACDFMETQQAPYVLKADGLAAGKGVIIAPDKTEAQKCLKEMMDGQFGQAGDKVVIESFLRGIEVSVFILTDGTDYKILPNAKDYKRIGEGDTGLNTGGMGAVSPVPFADKAFMDKVEQRIIRPTLQGLRKEGIDYKGFLFFGLMNCAGDPYVIEYNVRMGDPETQSVMLCLEGDLAAACMSLKTGTLQQIPLKPSAGHAVTVVAAMEGYPGPCDKGKRIEGLEQVTGATVFHMGTTEEATGLNRKKGTAVVTAGGRVLAVGAREAMLEQAQQTVYRQLKQVHFTGMYYRTDIGNDLL